jgi:ATP-dependent Clp protease ATP-binding subunit ClpX
MERTRSTDRFRDRLELSCSFCGRWQSEVGCIVAGFNVYICDECIAQAVDVAERSLERKLATPRATSTDP